MTRLRLLLLIATTTTTTAHFSLMIPKPLGSSDENQGTGPCGGYSASTTSSSPTTDFHVSGDSVAMENGHPQTTWLFRATLDQTAAGNWTQVFPIVLQTGLGSFCEPQIAVPAAFAGQKGIVSVVAHSPDGFLYACASVNFISGTAPTLSECKNASITVDFDSDPSLIALLRGGSSSGTPAGTTTSTPNAAAPSLAGSVISAGTVWSLLISLGAAVGGAAIFL